MKSRIFFNSVFLFSAIVVIKSQQPSSTTTSAPQHTQPTVSAQPEAQAQPAISVVSSPINATSIEQIMLSEINANDKIEDSIEDMIIRYSRNYSAYRAIHFTTSDYTFEKNVIEFDLTEQVEKGKISFNNFKVTTAYNNDPSDHKFSTLVRCNSTGNTTIYIDLPDIYITSNTSIILNSSLAQPPYRGSISITLKNGTFIGQIEVENNTLTNLVHSAEILNDKSTNEVEISSKYQEVVFKHLQNISTEIKHSMENYFSKQLNLQGQLIMNVTIGCSKAKHKTPSGQINLEEIYVIKNVLYDSWHNVYLSTGPAIIEGLANFDQIDFHIWDVSFQNFNTMPCYNEITLRMISNSLTGKFKWSYNYTLTRSPPLTYSFTIDYFEIKSHMKPVSDNDSSNIVKTDMVINLGKVTVFTDELNKSNDEKMFVNAILSDHLQSLMHTWLNYTLIGKILPKIGYFDCMTNSL